MKKTDVVEAKLKGDFKIFLSAIWHELNLPSPPRALYCIADYLQNGPKRLQVQAFRGIGKSYVTAAYVLWELYKDPDVKVMCVSASKERADNNSINQWLNTGYNSLSCRLIGLDCSMYDR